MSDLTKRLRSEFGSFRDMATARLEAADEIERLEDKLKTIERLGLPKFYKKELLDDMREFERLGEDGNGLGYPISVSEFLDAYQKDRSD